MTGQSKPLVIVIAYFFDPSKAVGAMRPWRFYEYLSDLGYDCRVITAFPPPGSLSDAILHVPDETAAIWDARAKQVEAGESTDSLPLSAQVDRLARRFFLPNQAGLIWYRAAASVAENVIGARRAVVFSTYPVLGTHLVGSALKRRKGVPWIADFRDPVLFSGWEQFAFPARFGLQTVERAILNRADIVIANTEPIADEWRQTYRNSEKIHVIWNGFDPRSQLHALPVPERMQKLLVHAGSLYGGRNANVVAASLERITNSGGGEKVALPAARILLVGTLRPESNSDKELCRRGVEQGWLEILPRVEREEAQRMTQEADGLLLLQPQSRVQVPAKLFEYLSIGRPILAVVPKESAVEWILTRSGVPFTCLYPEDPPEAADAKLREFLALPNTPVQPSAWYLREFDAKHQTDYLARLIETVLPR
jgi:hypothetical protein